MGHQEFCQIAADGSDLRFGQPAPGIGERGAPAASPYGEAECREDGGERGERDVDDYAPAVLAFLGHKGLGWFGGFMSRQNMP